MTRFVLALAATAACQSGAGQAPAHHALQLVDAPATGDVAAAVAHQLAAADAAHRHLVVYVGASWCEPCTYFHAAAASGALDDRLGDLQLLVFDNDRDHDALVAAGYRSAMIPLFAIPGPDGRASGRQIAGSIHGSGAADQIAPRLRALVDGG